MAYLCYCLWAPNCLAVLYYSIFPSLCLLKGIPLVPAVSTPWFLPFGYLIFANYLYSLVEFLKCGCTTLGWWNEQRTWLYKRTCSYLFAFVDTIFQIAGFGESGFVITAKVADDDVAQRYREELMEFGSSSAMFNILATVGMLNPLCFVGVVKGILLVGLDENIRVFDEMGLQIFICVVLVIINWPLYEALFFRIDKGRMPVAVTVNAFVFSFVACISFVLFY
ncbi:Cellulose synthase-like protein E1 [Linum grandiflorum]